MICPPGAVKNNVSQKILNYFATPDLAHLLLKAGQVWRERPDETGWARKDNRGRLGGKGQTRQVGRERIIGPGWAGKATLEAGSSSTD